MRSYSVKRKKQTLCIPGSEKYMRTKTNQAMMKCVCAECGITKTHFVSAKEGGNIDYSDWYPLDMYAGDRVNDPTNPLCKKRGGALARRRGPSTTDKIAWVASNFVTPAPSFGALGRVLAGQAFKGVKDNVDYFRKGKGVDIHKAILKVAPKKGFVMPGHRYTGPGNPLEKQVKWDPKTGKILEIYEQPTGKTDAVSMQHDVDYSVCATKPSKDQVKCKNEADRKMVKSLDAIPWKERQWGHSVARNAIASKAKLGLGVKKRKSKNGKGRRVKKTGKKN